MSRRIRTLLVGGVLFVVLFVLALTMPVPYVILSPGPTYNTLGTDQSGKTIIVLEGTSAKRSDGHLNMTTVDVSTQSISIFQALHGWLQHDEAVVPRSAVIPPGKSQEEVNRQNTRDFTASQDNAIAAASCELGYPKRFGVIGVQSSGASYHILEPADVFVTLDGQRVNTPDALTSKLATLAPGTSVRLGIERAGQPKTVTVRLGPPVSGRSGGSLGVTVGTICQMPFSVDLGLGNQIGGPSAGMMFALGIMDKVGKVDLTGGTFIAGTGTITPDGDVGPIGGIQLKMIAARAAGATVFLAPSGNCDDVRGATPKGLSVVKVDTLHGAVQALLALQQGRPVPQC